MKFEPIVLKYAVGIDISKSDFKVCFVSYDDKQQVKVKGSKTFKNTRKGFEQFLKWVEKYRKGSCIPIVFVVEATGVYYEECAFFIYQKQYDISVILPTKAKRYLQYLGQKSKNDKIDAKGLAQMAAEQSLKLWKPAAKFYLKLRALTRRHQSLQESRIAATNKIEAVNHSMYKDKVVLNSLTKEVNLYNREIKIIEKRINEHVASDQKILEKVEKITKLKGVALLTVSVVLGETFGFELFENFKQLISYAGFDVVENQSGKRSGKTRISKKGNSRLRRILHMAGLNTVKYKQTSFYNLYHRTYERHGIKMKSYVAVQKKVLTTIFALWKNDTAYDNEYHIKNNIQRKGAGVSLSGSETDGETKIAKAKNLVLV